MRTSPSLRVVFCDVQCAVADAFAAAFDDVEEVTAVCSPFETLADTGEFDALVSPANSFGIMDGGVDAAILDKYGPRLQVAVHHAIRLEYDGEQPVGTCLLVRTGADAPRWLLHAPTMQTPRRIDGTDNVYQAFRAVLHCARQGVVAMDEPHPLQAVLCPGLGTLTGGVTPRSSAAQCRLAWDWTMRPSIPGGWGAVRDRMNALAQAVYLR